MYLGIKLANSRFKNIFGTCLSNEKTSLYHEPIIRGLGVLYIFALSPIVFFIEESVLLNDVILVVFSTLASVLSVLLGLVTALYIDLPPSSLIIGTAILLFIVQAIAQTLTHKR